MTLMTNPLGDYLAATQPKFLRQMAMLFAPGVPAPPVPPEAESDPLEAPQPESWGDAFLKAHLLKLRERPGTVQRTIGGQEPPVHTPGYEMRQVHQPALPPDRNPIVQLQPPT